MSESNEHQEQTSNVQVTHVPLTVVIIVILTFISLAAVGAVFAM